MTTEKQKINIAKKCVNVAITLCDAKVYGGYIRDFVIRKESFNDLDIWFPNTDMLDKFILTLKCFYTKVQKRTNSVKYICHTTVLIINDWLNIDCVINYDLHLTAFRNLDFTCNLLYMNNKGINAFSPLMLNSTPNHVLIMKAMSDIKDKTFSILPHTPNEIKRTIVLKKLIDRTINMLKNDWIIVKYHDKEKQQIFVEKEIKGFDCCVCLDKDKTDYNIVLQCDHKLHYDCFKNLLIKTTSDDIKCPLCRELICTSE